MKHVDGWLYVGIAVAGCVLNHLCSKEAQELLSPSYLFFLKLYADVLGASCLAGKTYRSTTFANSLSTVDPRIAKSVAGAESPADVVSETSQPNVGATPPGGKT